MIILPPGGDGAKVVIVFNLLRSIAPFNTAIKWAKSFKSMLNILRQRILPYDSLVDD